jgi:osmoprotectant transport system ATP-binding protein
LIRFESVAKSFDAGHTFALRAVDLEVLPGETLVLLGSSGSGKSTLLRLVNRLITPSSGRVLLDGRDVAGEDAVALRRRIGYVFQGIGLFPHLTAAENVAMIPRLLGQSPAEQRERADQLLVLVGLDPPQYRDRFPGELSGGQQQRVGVARALAADPHYLLMDEPFGALDAITRDALQQELLALKARLGKTILFVTHDLFEALTLGDRIAVLHDGRLEQVGTAAEILREPRTEFVRDLFTKPARQLGLLRDHSGHE